MSRKTETTDNNDAHTQEFMEWYARVREENTVERIAFYFQVTERTVQNWLAKGLDCHTLQGVAGCEACAKHPSATGSGNMRWGLHPLAVLDWLILRETTPEPELVKLIRERAVEVYAWHRKTKFPGCEDPPPKKFTWEFYGEPSHLVSFMAWFWIAYFVKPSKGEIAIEDNPFVWARK
jgi:hypothetical protein